VIQPIRRRTRIEVLQSGHDGLQGTQHRQDRQKTRRFLPIPAVSARCRLVPARISQRSARIVATSWRRADNSADSQNENHTEKIIMSATHVPDTAGCVSGGIRLKCG
jgi:hypothetical protein